MLSEENNEEITEEEEDMKIQLQFMKNDICETEARNQEFENRIKELDAMNQDLKCKLDNSQLNIKQMEDKENELVASKAMLLEDLELKTKMIKELTETKVNAELDLNKIKNDYNELRLSHQCHSDENQELRNDVRKHKEKLERKNGELDTIAVELKLRSV